MTLITVVFGLTLGYATDMPVKMSEQRSKVAAFIKSHPVGVLATANTVGYPHAATVYFVSDEDLNIYFVTKEDTLKHKNLKQNPLASIAIYDAAQQITLQAHGKATVITDVDQFMDLYNQILKISAGTGASERPPISKLFAGDYFMYCLKPKSLRLAEYTKPDHGDFDLFQVIK